MTCDPVPEPAYVYILVTRDGGLTYVGWTLDLDQRLAAHNAGRGARFTRGRHWTLVYAERLGDRRAAMAREWRLKRDRALRWALAGEWA